MSDTTTTPALYVTENGEHVMVSTLRAERLQEAGAIYKCDECEPGTFHMNDPYTLDDLETL